MTEPIPLKKHLEDARTIAVMGCSDNRYRTSHGIAAYLQASGYRMIPVNPNHDEVLGERCYPDLAAIPESIRIDIVNIFRREQYTAEMVAQAVERAARTGETPLIWTQLGVSSPAAAQLAAEAGLPYVADRCLMVVHQQLLG